MCKTIIGAGITMFIIIIVITDGPLFRKLHEKRVSLRTFFASQTIRKYARDFMAHYFTVYLSKTHHIVKAGALTSQ
jgi:hypothetical protein